MHGLHPPFVGAQYGVHGSQPIVAGQQVLGSQIALIGSSFVKTASPICFLMLRVRADPAIAPIDIWLTSPTFHAFDIMQGDTFPLGLTQSVLAAQAPQRWLMLTCWEPFARPNSRDELT